MSIAVKVERLTKNFGRADEAFRLGPIDLELEVGASLGLIGPNGSGKSTLIHALLGLVRVDSGAAFIGGERCSAADGKWREKLGFVIDNPGYFEHLSVQENLEYIGSFYANWDKEWCRSLWNRLDLDPRRKYSTLSKGGQAKIALISALGHKPEVLILDEPTANLDPMVRGEFTDIIGELLRSGDHSVLMTSHILSDISNISDELCFLKNGQVIARMPKDDLLDNWRRISYRNPRRALSLPDVVSVQQDEYLHLVTTSNAEATLKALDSAAVEILDSNRLSLDEISVHILKGAAL